MIGSADESQTDDFALEVLKALPLSVDMASTPYLVACPLLALLVLLARLALLVLALVGT